MSCPLGDLKKDRVPSLTPNRRIRENLFLFLDLSLFVVVVVVVVVVE